MSYKKLVIFLSVVMCFLSVSGQTQQGYVKTKGRLGNNGSVIAGTRLSGATVTVKGGNAVVSGNKGTFSIAIPGNNYYLQNVQKQGYVLTDPDVLSKQYAYSKNALVLVLETPSQQTDDKIAVERQIRRTLQRQLQDKEDEIESLKKQQKLSEEEYRKQVQELYSQQESNEKLIGEMAERYSKMDFDEVDEFNRKISSLIIDGKLTEADSLLNTKGDINSRAVVLRQHQKTNTQEEQELKKKQKKLEKSKAMTQKELEDIAQDCYSKFEIFKMQHLNDSATYYIELRADLDTANTQWQNETGTYMLEYLAKYENALHYYKRALRNNIYLYGEDGIQVATSYHNIGYTFFCQHDYKRSLSYYQKALNIDENKGGNIRSIALTYNNLGALYSDQEEYTSAMEYYKKGLEIQKNEYGETHPDIAQTYNNIGMTYNSIGEYSHAIEYCEKALEIDRKLSKRENHLFVLYNNIGMIYFNQGNLSQALSYYMKADSLCDNVWGAEHPNKAIILTNIGGVYDELENYTEAVKYYQMGLDIRKRILGRHALPIAYSYNNIGGVYNHLKEYEKALCYYKEAFSITEMIRNPTHPDMAVCFNNLGSVYSSMNENKLALDFYNKALSILKEKLGDNHPNVAITSANIGSLYYNEGDYASASNYYNITLSVFKRMLGESHPYTQKIITRINEICQLQQRERERKTSNTK